MQYGKLNYEFSKIPMHTLASARNGSDFRNSVEPPDLILQPLAMGPGPWLGLMMRSNFGSQQVWQPLLLLFKVVGVCWQSFHLALLVRATHLPWIALVDDTGGTGLPGHEHWDLLSCPEGVWWHDSGRSVRPRGGRSGNPAWHHPRALCAAVSVWRIPRGPPGPPCEVERVHSAVKENRTVTASNSRLDRGTY